MDNSTERIERLLALLLVNNLKEAKQVEKIKVLNLAGFTNVEVAELLNTSPQVIANTLHKSKKNKK